MTLVISDPEEIYQFNTTCAEEYDPPYTRTIGDPYNSTVYVVNIYDDKYGTIKADAVFTTFQKAESYISGIETESERYEFYIEEAKLNPNLS